LIELRRGMDTALLYTLVKIFFSKNWIKSAGV
jgi:hypothetical protein